MKKNSGKVPTLIEALQRVVSEALRPWSPGTLLRRRPNFTVYLRQEPNDKLRANDVDWDEIDQVAFGIRHGMKTRRPNPILWTILDNHWDDRECLVWIRIIAVGDPNRRGWLRAIESDWNFRE